ncbi:MAG: fused MFS/spermidine synthase [Myxococcales bacterium]|nr:fused MFS/spermidine synthase [Myxococcales bacterium]
MPRGFFGAAYLLSSASALILEICWARALAPALGGSVIATSLTLAGFLGGLGAGAALGARASRVFENPSLRFASWQVAGAGLSFLPYIFREVGPLPGPIALAAIAIAATALGAAFPLAAQVRERDVTGRGPGFGSLYALDTFGGLLGVILGTIGIYLIGVPACLAVAAAAKMLASFVALAQAQRGSRTTAQPPEPLKVANVPAAFLILAGVTGFCLLGAENLWSRMLSFVVFHGSSSLSFAGMLACVLGSSSLGALFSRSIQPDRLNAGVIAALCGISLALSPPLLGLLGGRAPGELGVADALAVILTVGPGSFLSGMLFSLLCSMFPHPHANRFAGTLLCANLAGALTGSLSVGLLGISALGIHGAMLTLGLLLTGAGAAILFRRSRVRSLALVLFFALAAALAWAFSPLRLTAHLGEALFFREGREATVAVLENPPGVRRLFIDGVAVAGTDLLMQADQKTLSHLPLLLHPGPRRALTIGFGSGQTSASMLLHPDLAVDALEISPEVAAAAVHFKDLNRGLPGSRPERFHLHLADARIWLRETKQSFDVIVNDCTDLAYKSDASLYTEEFFRLVRSRLAPGGIGAAWLPLRADRPFGVTRAVVKAFLAAFPHGELWVFDSLPLHFGILVGGAGPLAPDVGRIERVLRDQNIASDLASVGLDDPHRLAVSRYAGPKALRRFSEGSPIHRDSHPVAEFLAAFERGGDDSACDVLDELGFDTSGYRFEKVSENSLHFLAPRASQRPFLLHGHCAYLRGRIDLARAFFIRALRLDPSDEVPRTLLGANPGTSPGMHGTVDRTVDRTGDLSHRRLAVIRLLEGKPDAAIELLAEAEPTSQLDPSRKIGMAMSLIYKDMHDVSWLKPRGLSPMVFQVLQGVEKGMVPQAELLWRADLARWLALLPGWLRWAVLSLTFAGL